MAATANRVSDAPADFWLAGSASDTPHDTPQARAHAVAGAPAPSPSRPFDRSSGGKALFRAMPMQFLPAATFRRRTGVVLRVAPHLSYASQLDDGPLHHAVLPNLLGWFGISRPSSFPPSLGVLGSHGPGVVPGAYDSVPRLASGPARRRGRNRLTCTCAFGVSDTSYPRTTLSLTIGAVASGLDG